MKITLRFAWYDLWIGAYVDTAKRTLYVCPLPCVLITISRRSVTPHQPHDAEAWRAGYEPSVEFGWYCHTCGIEETTFSATAAENLAAAHARTAGTSDYPPSTPNGENAGYRNPAGGHDE